MSGPRARLAIIGTGRVARALGRGLRDAGWPVARVGGRTPGRARAAARAIGPGVEACVGAAAAARGLRLVILAVPAEALPALARELAAVGGPGRTFLHCSGAAPDRALTALRRAGSAVGRLHPLFPFTGRATDARRLAGIWFGIGGDAAAEKSARRLLGALGARGLRVGPGAESRHHLSAVIASNLLVALAAQAAAVAVRPGLTRAGALRVLLPLMRRTLENLQVDPPERALTGPIARGESVEVEAHLRLLRAPALREAYRALSSIALDLARDRGDLPPGAATRLRRLLAPAAPPRRKK